LVEISLPKYILDDPIEFKTIGEEVVFTYPIKKIFPGQTFQTPEFHVVITNRNVDVINKNITVKVYSDEGISEKKFIIRDTLRYSNDYHSPGPLPLREDMFLPVHGA